MQKICEKDSELQKMSNQANKPEAEENNAKGSEEESEPEEKKEE